MQPKKYKFLIVLLLMATNTYANDSFEKAASQYCRLYNPESFSLLGQGEEPQEIFGHILEQQKIISNKIAGHIKDRR